MAVIERTTARCDEIAEAAAHLREVVRFAADAEAHLAAGTDPGHLEDARRVTAIAACAALAASREIQAALAHRLNELV